MISTRVTATVSSIIGHAILVLAAPACLAQEDPEQEIHWAYSAFFGSGYYKFGDSPGVTVLRVNLRRDITEASFEEGRRKAGFTVRTPVTIGHQGKIATAGELIAASVDTISFVPGVDVMIPVGERWTLKTVANVGYGWASGGTDSAWIYRGGLGSRYTFETQRFEWAFVNALTLVGFAGSNSTSQQSMPLTLGIESQVPLRNRKIGDDPVYLHWHVTQTHYLRKVEFLKDFGEPFLILENELELGAAFGKGDKRLRLWKFSWDRVGLAFRFDSDGDLTGFRLNFRSVFNR